MIDQELAAWIATQTGRSVRHLERVGYGASRATYIAAMATGGDVVARVDTGDGPMAGTELSLTREAEVYRALVGQGVRIPGLHALSSDGRVLLTDRATGTHELTALDDEHRTLVFDDLIDALAELHAVDPAPLDLPSYRRPHDERSHALAELDLWGGILDQCTTGPWPLAHFALRILHQCAPIHVSRTVLCHGDVGPGNFMHDRTRVTALLDWEFSHIGDPMDDLGWWVFRGHDMAGGCGDLAAQLRRWQHRTGLAVDVASIEYYRAFVMLRWLVSVASALDRGGAGMDRSVYFGLVPVLVVRLPHALARLLGVSLPPVEPIDDVDVGPNSEVVEVLRCELADVIAPAVTTPELRRRVGATLLYVSHLAAADRIGPIVRRATLAEVESLTGSRPADQSQADRAVASLVNEPGSSVDSLLGYFWREGHRQVALWPTVGVRALGAPTDLAGLAGVVGPGDHDSIERTATR